MKFICTYSTILRMHCPFYLHVVFLQFGKCQNNHLEYGQSSLIQKSLLGDCMKLCIVAGKRLFLYK